MRDPRGHEQAESAPVAELPCPSPPPLGEGRASRAQCSRKLQLALGALCLSTYLSFCLLLFVSVSLSFFLPVNCLHFSV